MSTAFSRRPLVLPRIVREEHGRTLGGVCSGIAAGLGVDVTLVRLTFTLLALAGGAGFFAYAGAWLLLPLGEGPPPSSKRRLTGAVLLALTAVLGLRGLGLSDSVVWPAALCAGGLLLARGTGRRSGARVTAGIVLIGLGVVLFVDRNFGEGDRATLLEPSGVVIALLLVLGPWAWRLAAERDAEQTVRIRAEERSELAARVHDSVLQTLALVQRESGDPRRVATLARRQERELRAWLYPGPHAEGAGLASAIEAAAAEVEELHGVPVELVRTGDVPLDDRVEAVVLAAREAMANAARHSGADEISTFVDADEDGISIFVHDRGRGFDPDAVPTNAHGIAESIRGRMARAGGTATITSSPAGTEVEMRLERQS